MMMMLVMMMRIMMNVQVLYILDERHLRMFTANIWYNQGWHSQNFILTRERSRESLGAFYFNVTFWYCSIGSWSCIFWWWCFLRAATSTEAETERTKRVSDKIEMWLSQLSLVYSTFLNAIINCPCDDYGNFWCKHEIWLLHPNLDPNPWCLRQTSQIFNNLWCLSQTPQILVGWLGWRGVLSLKLQVWAQS